MNRAFFLYSNSIIPIPMLPKISNLSKLSKKAWLITIGLSITAISIYLFAKKPSNRGFNQGFTSYIAAHTAGQISKESSIKIQLIGQFFDSTQQNKLDKIFEFEPKLKGETRWLDPNTIEFKPSEKLESGKSYECIFNLQYITDVPDELKEFNFRFSVIKQNFEISKPSFEALSQTNFQYQRVFGTLQTADVEDENRIEQMVQVSQFGKKFRVKWEHAANKRSHRFYADSIIRGEKESEVLVNWDGAPINVEKKDEYKLIIPALNVFSVIGAQVMNDGSSYIAVQFSDPLLQNQDLNGLINIDGVNLKFIIDGQTVKCYPDQNLVGSYQITLHTGIQNTLGKKLSSDATFSVDFEDKAPSVKFIGKGVIIPSSNQIKIPFEATSLHTVDVTIIKVFESNISQFLQVNNLDGTNELRRVGRPMLKKAIKLNEDKLLDLRKTNSFSIDLDKLIKQEPGALYQIKLSFKRSYSLYRCDGIDTSLDESVSEMEKLNSDSWEEEEVKADQSFWDAAEEDYDWNNYNWNERNNPCHNSYYTQDKIAQRNIMTTDIGLIAKKGSKNEISFFATHLISTDPLAGINIDLLDYQQQLICGGTTDSEGVLTLSYSRKPYLAIAKNGSQKTYLKIDDGSSLSLSQFDVSGETVEKGIKGFIFGERGVWRPGDSIYLQFILEDKLNTLPKDHPVTLELYNPLGTLYKRLVSNGKHYPFFDFRTATDPEAPTGTWIAKVKVGSSSFTKNIRVETVMPNRLKIELNFPTSSLVNNEEWKGKLKSRWLHGATASNLKAKVDISLNPIVTQFKRYTDYVFDNPSKKFSSESTTLFDDNLNENGEAEFPVKMELQGDAAGMLQANFTTKVFEPGGAFSTDRFQIPFHAYNSYVGIKIPKGDVARGMLLTDTNHVIKVVCLDANGNLRKGIRKGRAQLYKIQWRWWWDRSEDDLSNFANAEEYNSLMDEEIEIRNGVGNFNMRVNYPEWGRYLLIVSDQDGHSSGKAFYMDWPGWAGRAQKEGNSSANILSVQLNKPNYNVGEKAVITFPTPLAGRALLSIENGSEIVKTYWIKSNGNQSSFEFPITKDMQPNVYAHVTLVQPHGQTSNDLPIRLYGISQIKVEDPNSVLKPIIKMAESIRPDQVSTVKVSETNGKEMLYTLAIVDEGLLDLTRFKTPDPHEHFFAREALGVKTWDMYDYVMGAFGTQFNKSLSIGGDEGLNRKQKDSKAKRFKPAIHFMGPFKLSKGAEQTHSFTIKDYVGAVRVMVVSANDGAYGHAEKSVSVKKPLMVLASLPRVLRMGEQLKLPVSVFAMNQNLGNVQVSVKTNKLLKVVGSNQKSIRFSKPGDDLIYFDLEVKNTTGVGSVWVEAKAGNEISKYQVDLEIDNPNPYENNIYEGTIEPGKSWKSNFNLPGVVGTNTVKLELSSIPSINLESRLRELIQYPHGCVEQTTSAAFPQIALNQLTELSDGWKKEIDRNTKIAINKLRTYQNASGGFGYWQGESNPDDWSSSYVGHFLLKAEEAGYAIPIHMIENWKKYQKAAALAWMRNGNNHRDLNQAYRLYTLALAGAPELGAMNRLKEISDLSENARWRLAAAYALAGNKETGKKLIENEKLKVKVKPEEQEYSYGSEARDEALMLETLILLNEKKKAYQLLQKVCNNLGSQEFMSTQSAAYSLLAVASLSGKYSENEKIEFTYELNGQSKTFSAKGKFISLPLEMGSARNGSIKVFNSKGNVLFAKLITRGKPAINKQKAAQNNLMMEVVYKDMDNKVINPETLKQGMDFKIEVSISNPGLMGNYPDLALSMVMPSAWEIHNERIGGIGSDQEKAYSTPRYQDIRDDRILSYFELDQKQKAVFVFYLNASYQGKFYAPGFVCERMYHGHVQAKESGKWIQVIP